jgi:hypothetical protein
VAPHVQRWADHSRRLAAQASHERASPRGALRQPGRMLATSLLPQGRQEGGTARRRTVGCAMHSTAMGILLLAAKWEHDALFCKPNGNKCILLVSLVPHARGLAV